MSRIAGIVVSVLVLVLILSVGCGLLNSGAAGVSAQQNYQKEVEQLQAVAEEIRAAALAAGVAVPELPSVQPPTIPMGTSTAEIISYSVGSIAVLLSGLFLGKRYMPRQPVS